MNKAIVTGGAGFIGSHLVEQLVQRGNNVTVYDNLTSGRLSNLSSLKSDVDLIKGDIRDKNKLVSSMYKADWVFHLAALTSVSYSVADPLLTYEINVTGTLNVLWAALRAGVSRVVIASSCAVYGEVCQPFLKETDLPKPKSPYATSKLITEIVAEDFYQSYGLEVICLRFFNVYGSRQRADSEYAAVIPRFLQCYKEKQAPQVYGDGLQSRDFIHVTDVARANILAMLLPSTLLTSHRVFNVGTGVNTKILEIIDIISNKFGYQMEIKFQEAKKGDIKNSTADCTLTREKLGLTNTVDIKTGIRELIDQESTT
ncbi:NAD-dependent epimerase/dehydratase [Nostoc sp. NIES-3756]|uniref:NAD-dependent epimerase/dehydratase family protein n=1 Tax=Nostoc sp. NIES-3756 TaxID=1751286 RepID=UPI0007205C9A|nr:NAD-dependent epimerase/dehydratase family protein [Nostoc sp. NIES-3756]BAT51467.1 NAD-dependent epimerase/dehydratase [Nostoc sp. NIES-3756]